MKPRSGKELAAALERHGWQLGRVRGSHHIYTHPDRIERLSVPIHGSKVLKAGLFTKLMKDARLVESDL